VRYFTWFQLTRRVVRSLGNLLVFKCLVNSPGELQDHCAASGYETRPTNLTELINTTCQILLLLVLVSLSSVYLYELFVRSIQS